VRAFQNYLENFMFFYGDNYNTKYPYGYQDGCCLWSIDPNFEFKAKIYIEEYNTYLDFFIDNKENWIINNNIMVWQPQFNGPIYYQYNQTNSIYFEIINNINKTINTINFKKIQEEDITRMENEIKNLKKENEIFSYIFIVCICVLTFSNFFIIYKIVNKGNNKIDEVKSPIIGL